MKKENQGYKEATHSSEGQSHKSASSPKGECCCKTKEGCGPHEKCHCKSCH